MTEMPGRRDVSSPGRRVLVVDDHPDVRAVLSLALAQAGIADVVTAADGQEALAVIEHGVQWVEHAGQVAFDLIVLDMMMPGLSGSDVLRALRARFTELPPVLIVSALDSPARVDEAMELGAAEYLSKPIQIDVLREKVRALIHAPTPRPAACASLENHDGPNVETSEATQRQRPEKAAARNALWIG